MYTFRQPLVRFILLFSVTSFALLDSQIESSSTLEQQRRVPPEQVRLPNGKLQQDEILKEDHERSMQDVKQLVALSQGLQKDLEQAGADVLSIASIHKTEEIEKLAKRIRSRMRRS